MKPPRGPFARVLRRTSPLVLLLLLVAACGGGGSSVLGTRDEGIRFLEGEGYIGAMTDADTWAGSAPDGSLSQLVGPASGLTQATLRANGDAQRCEACDPWIGHFAPGAEEMLAANLAATADADQDQRYSINGRSVRMRTVGFGDQIRVTLDVTPG